MTRRPPSTTSDSRSIRRDPHLGDVGGPCGDDADRLRRGPGARRRAGRRNATGSARRSRRSSDERTGPSRPGSSGRRSCCPRSPRPVTTTRRYLMLLRADVAVLALPGRGRRDDRLGALGCDPPGRVDPRRTHDAVPRQPDRDRRGRDAVVQPLRLRRGRRLGLSPRRRDRAGGTWLPVDPVRTASGDRARPGRGRGRDAVRPRGDRLDARSGRAAHRHRCPRRRDRHARPPTRTGRPGDAGRTSPSTTTVPWRPGPSRGPRHRAVD